MRRSAFSNETLKPCTKTKACFGNARGVELLLRRLDELPFIRDDDVVDREAPDLCRLDGLSLACVGVGQSRVR